MTSEFERDDNNANLDRRPDLETVEASLGHRFADRSHLLHALTHGSAKDDTHPSNERLEFLGDAILGMIVSTLLFADHPDLDEGQLTQIKAQTVSKKSLAVVAEALDLRRHLIVGRMFASRAQLTRSVLADAVEALIAAIYLDGGFDAAIDFVVSAFRDVLRDAAAEPGESDYKSRLGQWAQKQLETHPRYRVLAIEGPDHERVFEVSVSVGGAVLGTARGPSKKAAEQRAARVALAAIEAEST